MKVSQLLKSAVLGLGLVAAAPAFADGDSSADAAPGFRDVSTSAGVLIRVPIDEQGRELSSGAEMRVHKGADLDNQSVDLKAAFDHATAIPAEAIARDSSTSADSSTNHNGGYDSCNYGWNSWYGNYGWQPSYYYSTYTPTYYYYGSYYTYNRPTYSNYYTNYNSCDYYGYRYYYYHHCW